jgi:hypothetical protein
MFKCLFGQLGRPLNLLLSFVYLRQQDDLLGCLAGECSYNQPGVRPLILLLEVTAFQILV